MKKHSLSAADVKKSLNLTTNGSLPQEKLDDFLTILPYVEKDVAIEVIKQFPAFTDYAKQTVEHYLQLGSEILVNNANCTQYVMTAYQRAMDIIGELAKRENATEAERRYFAEKVIEIADRMADVDRENKRFLSFVQQNWGWFLGGTIALAGGLFGIKLGVFKSPRIKL